MSNWTAVLDVLEGQLRRQEYAFRNAGELPNGMLVDAPDQPMTAGEQVRAIDLMQRHDDLITETVELLRNRRPKHASPYG